MTDEVGLSWEEFDGLLVKAVRELASVYCPALRRQEVDDVLQRIRMACWSQRTDRRYNPRKALPEVYVRMIACSHYKREIRDAMRSGRRCVMTWSEAFSEVEEGYGEPPQGVMWEPAYAHNDDMVDQILVSWVTDAGYRAVSDQPLEREGCVTSLRTMLKLADEGRGAREVACEIGLSGTDPDETWVYKRLRQARLAYKAAVASILMESQEGLQWTAASA